MIDISSTPHFPPPLQAGELSGRRPLIPPGMPMNPDVKEVLDTFRVVAELGSKSLGAYVISMAQNASDVLAVELLQREANMMVSPSLAPPRLLSAVGVPLHHPAVL